MCRIRSVHRNLIRAKLTEAKPSNMLAVRCQRCRAKLGEVGEKATDQLFIKCKRCDYMNKFMMPDVDPIGSKASAAQAAR